ncbi:unknown [Prevotella sp. CAG:5226]|nr:unknown [Prevotella sp. CAG:5226]
MKRFFSANRSAYTSINAGIVRSVKKKFATNDLYKSLLVSIVCSIIALTVPLGTANISPNSFTRTSLDDILLNVKGNNLYFTITIYIIEIRKRFGIKNGSYVMRFVFNYLSQLIVI